MALGGDDAVGARLAIERGSSVLTVCEKGFGKRTSIEEYRKTRRGGKGVINIKTTERNGAVIAIEAVVDGDELMLITQKGMMLRTDLTALRQIGRATQGVRLIRLREQDKVVAVAKIAKDDQANGTNNGVTGNSHGANEGGADPNVTSGDVPGSTD